MSGQDQAKLVSRRGVVSLLVLAAAAGFGALTASDAEAQTTTTTPAAGTAATKEATGTHGMQRRKGRDGRHERRDSGAPAKKPPQQYCNSTRTIAEARAQVS